MEIVDVLTRARALVQTGWCQIHMAEDAYGEPIGAQCSDAVAFCAIGAIRHASNLSAIEYDACGVLIDTLGDEDVGKWNDAPERTKAEVLALFDRAIANARS